MSMERINYREINGYFIPILSMPEEERIIGCWGRMRLKYLKEQRPIIYSHLLLSGKLQEHLADINELAVIREQFLIEQLKEAEGITEEMKELDQREWIRRMNSIAARVREWIMLETIFE